MLRAARAPGHGLVGGSEGGRYPPSVQELKLVRPFLDLPLGLLFGDAIAFLNDASKLLIATFQTGKIIVREVAPLLLHLALHLVPVTLDLIPVHHASSSESRGRGSEVACAPIRSL